jgi:hypothetical protein
MNLSSISKPSMPSTNEIEISGLTISSGGHNWAGFTAIVPLQVSDPSQFYVRDINGNLTKVDIATAAQLYATTSAIRSLNYLYGPYDAADYPAMEWQPVVDRVRTDLSAENLLTVIEDFGSELGSLLPEALGLDIPGYDVLAAASLIEGVVCRRPMRSAVRLRPMIWSWLWRTSTFKAQAVCWETPRANTSTMFPTI